MTTSPALPAVGIGYRSPIADWTRKNLDRFDALEITVDHCISGSKTIRSAIFDLIGRILSDLVWPDWGHPQGFWSAVVNGVLAPL